jgi:hypothetical protein
MVLEESPMDVWESLYILVIFGGVAFVVRRSKEPVAGNGAWDRRLRRLVLVLPIVALIVLVHAVIVAI